MAFLSDQDKQRVREAVEAVEGRTSGEFVTVIAQAADDYLYIPVLWAALIALLIPGVLDLVGNLRWLEYSYSAQIVGFILAAVVFRWPPLKMRLIPRSVQHQRAHRVALEQFMLQNLSGTEGRTGVLLFVSVAEHYVEIIADKGINDKVADDAWTHVVGDFIQSVRTGEVANGFVRAINACGDLLEEHFPVRPGDRNELPDHLVEL